MPFPTHLSHFASLRRSGAPVVDKTAYIHALESGPTAHPFLLFLRPPGFGKSLLSSVLEHYYDRALCQDFDSIFEGLSIHSSPTPLKGSYRVLYLDLSPVEAATGPKAAIAALEGATRASIAALMRRQGGSLIDDPQLTKALRSDLEAGALLTALFIACAGEDCPLFVLVDAFEGAADPPGPFATALAPHIAALFGALKAGTRLGSVARILVTGTTPLPPEALGLGQDILVPVTESPALLGLCGWSREECVGYIKALPQAKIWDIEGLVEELEALFGGYHFRPGVKPPLMNPRGVLRALRALSDQGALPEGPRALGLGRPSPGERAVDLGPGGEAALGETLARLLGGAGISAPIGGGGWIARANHQGLVTRGPRREGLEVYGLPNRVAAMAAGERLLSSLAERAEGVPNSEALAQGVSRLGYRGELAPLVSLLRPLLRAVAEGESLPLRSLTLVAILRALTDQAGVLRTEVISGDNHPLLHLSPITQEDGARFAWVIAPRYLPAGTTGGELEEALELAEGQAAGFIKSLGAAGAPGAAPRYKSAALVVVGSGACHWQIAGAQGVVQGV